MSGSDLYNDTGFDVGSWSDTVTYTPALGNVPASVEVGGIGASTVNLDGTVSVAGASVTLTIDADGQVIQRQLQAVSDITGGGVFSDGAGDYYVFANGQLVAGDSYDVVAGFGHFGDGAPVPACFAQGTCIETREGPVPVEALRPGDQVRAVLRGQRGAGWAPVIWTGHRRIACHAYRRPEEAWPVRIAAGAFGPGRPGRDLFLSPDHAVFDGEGLVPVRYLVNDAMVAPHPVRRITYWHVELPSHDLLLAEGLEVESFLDTGNRAAFEPGGRIVALAPDLMAERTRRAWRERACAPLRLLPAEHRPLRRRLRERALELGWTETADAGLELRVGGVTLGAGWNGTEAAAVLPAGVTGVRLCSRSLVPSQATETSTDGRRLGVAVTRIRLDGREVALDDPRLNQGWHQPEGAWRWTDGDALIPLTGGRPPRRIEILTAPMLAYWQPSPDRAGVRRAA